MVRFTKFFDNKDRQAKNSYPFSLNTGVSFQRIHFVAARQPFNKDIPSLAPCQVSSRGIDLMATTRRQIPKHLGKKLKQVREHLGIKTYDEMILRLNVKEASLYRASIYRYENGEREPSLIVLLRYSQLAGITINDLVDDMVELRF